MENVNFESEISMKNCFFIKNFSGLHYNANTFWVIQRMWKVLIVVSQAVNDTLGSAHVIQHSLKLQVIVKFRSKILMKNVFSTTFFHVLHDIVNIFCVTQRTWTFKILENVESHVLTLRCRLPLEIQLWKLSTFSGWSTTCLHCNGDQKKFW